MLAIASRGSRSWAFVVPSSLAPRNLRKSHASSRWLLPATAETAQPPMATVYHHGRYHGRDPGRRPSRSATMIDFHQHIGHRGRTVEHLLAHQDAYGVRQAVVLPIDRSLSEGNDLAEHMPVEQVLAAAGEHPDRVIPFCHVDPRHPDALDRVRRYH